MINYLNVRHETIKCLRKNYKEKILDIGIGNHFLGKSPKVQATKMK